MSTQAENKYTGGRAKKSRRGASQTEAEDNRQEQNSAAKTAFKTGPHANDPEVNRRPVKSRMGEQSDAGDKRAHPAGPEIG